MDEILKVLTLYDITAYLLPGLVVVGSVVGAARRAGWRSAPRWSWKLVVVAYIVGQLLQVIASDRRHWLSCRVPVHLQKLDQVFPDGPDGRAEFRVKLTEAINQTFDCPPAEDWFLLCETYLQARKLDSFIVIMQARYGFFRGLFFSLVVAALAYIVALLVCARKRAEDDSAWHKRITLLILFAVCAIGAWLSWNRTADFDQYYAWGTYRAFYVNYLHEQTSRTSASADIQ